MPSFFKKHPTTIFHVILLVVMVTGWVWTVAKRDADVSTLQDSDAVIAESVKELRKETKRDREAIIRAETRQEIIREDVADIKRDVKTLVREIKK